MQAQLSHESSARRARTANASGLAPRQRVVRREWTVAAPPAAARGRGACACGGSCPRCRAGRANRLRLSEPGDALEREADAVATRIAAGEAATPHLDGLVRGGVQRTASSAASHPPAGLAPEIDAGLRSPGRPLAADTLQSMQARLGHDLGSVRIHTGAQAAASAAALHARAYTVGSDIVFGAGAYAPASAAGRHLLAHELVHVLQQRAGIAPAAQSGGELQRAPTISVMDENFIGPPSTSQRRAAKSCPIDCCFQNLGMLHTMPLFFHESRGAIVPEGSPRATGIGAELHFIAASDQPAAGDLCHCDAFQMIQILTTTHPGTGHTATSYVDNGSAGTQPFYGAPAGLGRSGHGEHPIPGGYVDAGERITTTESIYDRPYRERADLGTTSLSWQAETCVACVKNTGPDLILGCTTYGFTQNYNAATSSFDPVQQIAPGCGSRPSANFTATLASDPTTSSYDFKPAPLLECFNPTPPGDYPLPSGDTRFA